MGYDAVEDDPLKLAESYICKYFADVAQYEQLSVASVHVL